MTIRTDHQPILEDLSSLVDNELDAGRSRFLVQRLENDQELADRWERYHLAGDCLRRRDLLLAANDLGDRVARALAQEPAPGRPSTGLVNRWTGGIALAASVALAVSLVFTAPTPEAPVGPVATVGSERPVDAAASVISDAEFEAYMIRHNNALRQNGLEGFAPFVDLVTSAGAESAVLRSRNGLTELR
jgi:hypothetical protein